MPRSQSVFVLIYGELDSLDGQYELYSAFFAFSFNSLNNKNYDQEYYPYVCSVSVVAFHKQPARLVSTN